jgi:WD40 repeat protein
MSTLKYVSFHLIIVIIVLLLPACATAAPASQKPAQLGANQPKNQETAPLVDPTDGLEPLVKAPVASPVSAGMGNVIRLENLTRLVPHLLELPEYPERVLWPAPGIPGIPAATVLLVQSEDHFYPMVLVPATGQTLNLLDPIVLPLNGNRIVAIAPDASSLLVQEPGRLAVYTIDGRMIREIDELDRTGYAVYSPESTALAITSQEEFGAYVYGLDGSSVKLDGFETAAPVYGAVLGPLGKTLAWISRGTLQLHDVTAVHNGLGRRLDFTGFIGPVTFSPDGSRLALDVEGNLHLYRVADGSLMAQLALDAPLSTLAFSPDGSILAANFRDGFQTWNGEMLEPLVSLPGGGTDTLWTGFSPDGRLLLTLHNDNELRLWRVE